MNVLYIPILKKGDKVRVKTKEGIPPLEFIIEDIIDGPMGKMVSSKYGDTAIDLVEVIEESKKTEVAELTLEQEVEQMASCGFTHREMALSLDLSQKQFIAQATTPDSKIWLAIKKGQLGTELSITHKQKELAAAGNITAVQVYEKLMKKKKLQQLKEQIYFGE